MWYDMWTCEQARWTLVFLSKCSRSQRQRWILYRIFFHRFQTIFDPIKTELSVATEALNQTRPWIALALLNYSSSRDRLTTGQIAQSLSSQILLGIGGKRSIKNVPKPRNGKLCKYCLLYSSGEILESIARSLFTLTINEDTTANVYLYLCWGIFSTKFDLRKLALSRNESTIHSSCMNFDAMKYPSVEHQLLMRKVKLKWRRRTHSHNLWLLLVP